MIHRDDCDRDYVHGCGHAYDDARVRDYGYAHGDCGRNDRDHDAHENTFDVRHFLWSLLKPEIFREAFLPFVIRAFWFSGLREGFIVSVFGFAIEGEGFIGQWVEKGDPWAEVAEYLW